MLFPIYYLLFFPVDHPSLLIMYWCFTKLSFYPGNLSLPIIYLPSVVCPSFFFFYEITFSCVTPHLTTKPACLIDLIVLLCTLYFRSTYSFFYELKHFLTLPFCLPSCSVSHSSLLIVTSKSSSVYGCFYFSWRMNWRPCPTGMPEWSYLWKCRPKVYTARDSRDSVFTLPSTEY